MSRTLRKSRVDVVYPEGQHGDNLVYKCKCDYCQNKSRVEEKVADQELKIQLLDWHHGYMTDSERQEWYNMSADEWDAIEEARYQEELDWDEYQEKQAA